MGEGGVDFHHSCINMVQMSQRKQEFMLHLHNALYIHGWHSWLKTCNDLGLEICRRCDENVEMSLGTAKIGHNRVKARNK